MAQLLKTCRRKTMDDEFYTTLEQGIIRYRVLTSSKNGDNDHIKAPRGSKTGTQGMKNSLERSRIPDKLCDYIVKISEEYINGK